MANQPTNNGQAGQDLQMANEKKLAEMKAQYDALLKKANLIPNP